MKLFFVRHGQTNYNVLKLCNDDPKKDVHLTGLGIEQTKYLAEKLKDTKFEIIFVSQLPRTMETASILNKYHEVPIKVDKRIDDRKTGFESRPVKDFEAAIAKDLFNMKVNDGESFQEEKKRFVEFINYIRKLKYQIILIITHHEIMKIAEGYFNKLPDHAVWDKRIENIETREYEI